MGIPIIDIGQFDDRFIFIIGIPIPQKTGFFRQDLYFYINGCLSGKI